jgi:putative molybdopterin biosynthesis protein
MKKIRTNQSFEQIKLLADSRRMKLLRLLMASPATLTQLAKKLGQSPAWVRHHILALESAGLIELSEIRRTGKVTEKYYRAKASAILLQEIILPKTKKPVIIFSGSHDLALETIVTRLERRVHLLTLPVGSLDGLVNLRQGLCQISGAHLLDESGDYNTPYVRRIFPDRDMLMITLAHRTQGLMLAPGNPMGIRGASNLARIGLRFINRNPGSGTRLWLDAELKRLGIPVNQIGGYEHTVSTHTACARAISNGESDAAVGLQAAAQKHGLEFIPLFDERYDLVFSREHKSILEPLLDYIQTRDFRKAASALDGYSTTDSGKQISQQ